MKALDTPILLGLLRGEERIRTLLRGLKGVELATTEWNLLELELALRADSRPGRERRRAALDRLRRRLTVIPIDDSALRAAREVRGEPTGAGQVILFAMLSALQSRRCEALLTTRAVSLGRLRSGVRIEIVQ